MIQRRPYIILVIPDKNITTPPNWPPAATHTKCSQTFKYTIDNLLAYGKGFILILRGKNQYAPKKMYIKIN